MAAPFIVFESAAAIAGTTSAISVPRPAAGVGKAGDFELLFVESSNQTVATPSGFAILPSSPVGVGTAAGTTATRISIFYRFNTGETANISVASPGEHSLACLVVLRGVDPALPIGSLMVTYSNGTAGTSFTQTGFNVSTDYDAMMFAVVVDQIDSTSSQGIVPNATFQGGNSYTWTAKSYRTTSGNGGGITYRRATVLDSVTNPLTAINITSTGSIIPCAIYFFVRGCRYGSSAIKTKVRLSTAHTTTDADSTVFPLISGEASATAFSGTTSVTITRLTNTKTGCLELIVAEYYGADLPVPAGWEHVPNSPVIYNNISATLSTSLSVFWRIADGDMSNVVLAAATDHIVAVHAILFNCDENDPFVFGLGGFASLAGVVGNGKSLSTYTYPAIPVILPDGTNIAAIDICANSIDSTIGGQAYAMTNCIRENFDYFIEDNIAIDFDLQSESGNGGGIVAFGSSFVLGEREGDTTYRALGFTDFTASRDSGSDAGVAALSFVLKNKASENFRYGCSDDFRLKEDVITEHLINSNVVVKHADVEASVVETAEIFTSYTAIKQYAYRDAIISEAALVSTSGFVEKTLIESVSLLEVVEVTASYAVTGPSRPAIISLASSVLSYGGRAASRIADVEPLLSTFDAGGLKGGRSSMSVPQAATALMAGSKDVAGSVIFAALAELIAAHSKNSFSESSVQAESHVFLVVSKEAFRDLLVLHSTSIWGQGRLVTAFEYGDLIIVDLRATPLGLEQSCVRLSPVVEVRMGEDLEFSATREGLEAPGRRRTLEIIGEQARLLGKEIVCVREVFDESK